MSGPEVAKTPGGGAPGKEGKEPVANGHAGEGSDANPFAEYMWMENEEEYNRQVCVFMGLPILQNFWHYLSFHPATHTFSYALIWLIDIFESSAGGNN